MANDSTFTIPSWAKRDGFWPVNPNAHKGFGVLHLGIANTVVIAKGDTVVDNGSGGLALGTDGGLTPELFKGVSIETAGSATGAANASTLCAVIPFEANVLYYAKVETGTISAAHTGDIVDLASEDGIDVTDSTTGGIGFHIYKFDTTNGYAIGVFRQDLT